VGFQVFFKRWRPVKFVGVFRIGQKVVSGFDIMLNLPDQVVNIVKLFLRPDPANEMQPDMTAVMIAVKIKQVGFQKNLTFAKGWPYPDIGDPIKKLVSCTFDPSAHGINAKARHN
jgi:hypothetical protein